MKRHKLEFATAGKASKKGLFKKEKAGDEKRGRERNLNATTTTTGPAAAGNECTDPAKDIYIVNLQKPQSHAQDLTGHKQGKQKAICGARACACMSSNIPACMY